jgi:hypothetical protein
VFEEQREVVLYLMFRCKGENMWNHKAACEMKENRCVGKTKYISGEWKTVGREDLSEVGD